MRTFITRTMLEDSLAKFSDDGKMAYVQSHITHWFVAWRLSERTGDYINVGEVTNLELADRFLAGDDVEMLT